MALVDCAIRDQLFQYLIIHFDRKAVKNEMVSPYDDQMIGKMNFQYGGSEHSMFFTYARSSEYPGKRFRNHKIIYLSLDVNPTSSEIFQQICERFGGYVIHDDDLTDEWTKIDKVKLLEDDGIDAIVEERREYHEEERPSQMEAKQNAKAEQKASKREKDQDRKENDRKDNERESKGEGKSRHEKPERNEENEKNEKSEKGNHRPQRKEGGRNFRGKGGKPPYKKNDHKGHKPSDKQADKGSGKQQEKNNG